MGSAHLIAQIHDNTPMANSLLFGIVQAPWHLET
jgi:hypothetical protein